MKLKKVIAIVITIFTIFNISNCYAENESVTLNEIKEQKEISSVTDPTKNQKAYKPGKAKSSKVQGKVGPILGNIRNVGIVSSVIFLMIIGIKAMIGSAEERAEYKKQIPKYLIGVAVLMMGSVIPQLIYNTMK